LNFLFQDPFFPPPPGPTKRSCWGGPAFCGEKPPTLFRERPFSLFFYRNEDSRFSFLRCWTKVPHAPRLSVFNRVVVVFFFSGFGVNKPQFFFTPSRHWLPWLVGFPEAVVLGVLRTQLQNPRFFSHRFFPVVGVLGSFVFSGPTAGTFFFRSLPRPVFIC